MVKGDIIITDEADYILKAEFEKVKIIKAGNGSIIEGHTAKHKIRGFDDGNN